MTAHRLTRSRSLALLGALAAAACSDTTGVAGPQSVTVAFQVASPAAAPGAPAAAGPRPVAGPPMVLAGTNGTLTIDEIRIIINEVELDPADGSCDAVQSASDDDDCPDFEAPPRFLDLPLDGQPIEAVTALIDPGTYKQLDFEVEDLEDDETDPAEAAAIEAVRAEIQAEFPDWPREASALVAGSFAPTSGGSIDFRVYLEAEIEVEMELNPRLVIDEGGAASRDVVVDIAPSIWFSRPDGTVLPLHLYDFDQTRELLEFEVEMEDGFTEIEFDD